MFINLETKEVIDRAGLEAAHQDPLVLFPPDNELTDEVLNEFGYGVIQNYNKPPLGEVGKVPKRGEVVFEDGQWFQKWVFEDMIVTAAMVDSERDRRIDLGFTFKGVKYESKPDDRENISGAVQLAAMAIFNGVEKGDYRWNDPDYDFSWITSDNSIVKLDAYDTFALGKAAAEQKQKMLFAARNLKTMSPIPSDYNQDKWWP